MPGARLTRLTIGSTPYGQHGNPLANQLRSRVQYEIDCPLLDYSRRISASVVNVAATIAETVPDFCDCRGECVRIQRTLDWYMPGQS